MTRKASLLLSLVLAVFVCIFVAGCGARPVSTPIAPSTPWIASLLGGPSQMSIAVRPQSFLRDPYWGPAMQRTMARPMGKEDPDDVADAQLAPLYFGAQQMELFIAVRDLDRAMAAETDQIGSESIGYVFVIRGMPVTDPMLFTTRRNERVFAPPVRLPSGVLEYAPAPAYALKKRGLAARVFIMPDGTWVGVDHGTAQRAHAIYMVTPVAPPPMALDDDALAVGFMDATLVGGAARRAAASDPTWQHDLRGAGLVLRGGKNGAVDVMLDYASSDAADRSRSWVESEMKATCRNNELACGMVKAAVRDVDTSQSGARVGVRFFFSERLLSALSRAGA